MKIVINCDFGGFSLSREACEWMAERGDAGARKEIREAMKDLPEYPYAFASLYRDVDRASPLLVECVEALGEKAAGEHATLNVVDVPDGVKWEVHDENGIEWVAEKHRTWR